MLLRTFFWQQFTEWRARWTAQQAQPAILLALFIRYGLAPAQRLALQKLLQGFRAQPSSAQFRNNWQNWLQQTSCPTLFQDWPLQEEVEGQVQLLQAALDLPPTENIGPAFAQLLRESRWDLRQGAPPLPAQLAQLLLDSLQLPAHARLLEYNFGAQLTLLAPTLPAQQPLLYPASESSTEQRLGELALRLLHRTAQPFDENSRPADALLANLVSNHSLEADLEKALEQVNENGRLALLVPQDFLQQKLQRFREWLLRKDWIEALIQLPPELLPQQKKPFALLLLNKRKPEQRWLRVLFIDAHTALPLTDQQGAKKWSADQQKLLLQALQAHQLQAPHPLADYRAWASIEAIVRENFALRPARYASPILADLQQLDKLQPFGHYFLEESPRIWLENQQDYPFLSSKNLSHSFGEARLRAEALSHPDTPQDGQLLRQAALLLRGPVEDLRLAYYDGQQPLLVAEDILLLYPKPGIDSDYLLLRFFDPWFLKQLRWRAQLREGPLQAADIQQLLLPAWNAEQRAQWIREQKRRLLQEEERKVAQLRRTLDSDKQRAVDQQLRIVASLQHELGNKLPAALNELHTLREYLQGRIDQQQPPAWEEPLFPEWEENDNHLRALLQRLEYNLHYALDSLSASSHLLRTDRKRLNKESLCFKDLLEELAEKYSQHPQFDLEINVEKEEGQEISTHLQADAQQWRIALENLVENALRHGFSDERRHRIRFSLEQSADGQYLHLRYQNDGQPFPENFGLEDFIRYGQYAGEAGRTGIGGFLIHRILENHNGSLHWHCTEPPQWPFPVDLELRFPRDVTDFFLSEKEKG